MAHSTVEIIEAADSQDLVTLDLLKTYLKITTTQDDAYLQTLIHLASDVIAGMCDRSFGKERLVETFPNMDGTAPLVLSRFPVTEIFNFEVDNVDTLYDIDPDGHIWQSNHAMWTGTVAVEYMGGWDLPEDAPGRLSLATIELCKDSYFAGARDRTIQSITDNNVGSVRFFAPAVAAGQSTGGRSGGGGGGKSGTPFNQSLAPMIEALIFSYRRILI